MNASTFRNENMKKTKNIFSNGSSSRNGNNNIINPRSNQKITRGVTPKSPTTTKELNDKIFNAPDNISIEDVLYGNYTKPSKGSSVFKFNDIHDEDKPNKKNIKILRKFLKQEADKINKSDF